MKKTLILTLVISACGSKTTGGIQTVTNTVEVQAAPVPLTPIEEIIKKENDYRFSKGQAVLTKGLTCSLYNLLNNAVPVPPQPQPNNFPMSLPSASQTWGYTGTFNQESSNGSLGSQLVPKQLRSVYTQWYAIKCTGNIVIVDSGYHQFETNSDDASLLYIDNVLIVNNDGNHGMQTRSGGVSLHNGVHTFRIDFMQGVGSMGFIVNFDGNVMPSEVFFR